MPHAHTPTVGQHQAPMSAGRLTRSVRKEKAMERRSAPDMESCRCVDNIGAAYCLVQQVNEEVRQCGNESNAWPLMIMGYW